MKKKTAKKTIPKPSTELGELIELQKESISIQKDIRALLLSLTTLRDEELRSFENLHDKAGPHLYMAKMLGQTSQLYADSVERQLSAGLVRAKEDDQKLTASINEFWGDYLQTKGRDQSAVELIKEGKLSFRDLIAILSESHGYPKNVTRCSSDIEIKIRESLKKGPDNKKYFDEFFAEAKKSKSVFSKVPITFDQMPVILEIMGVELDRLKYVELAPWGQRVPIHFKRE